ncbi:hypothetical protein KI387_022760 [Taxus chinensis]|uniref:Myb-like domain-containing protein n=1 Tax=Taxus chinensis TaxID=29808 RepID=A0AA38L6W3_TAXCH|nr:hypothetical protein KI387_022760 [Taxus chinensis]
MKRPFAQILCNIDTMAEEEALAAGAVNEEPCKAGQKRKRDQLAILLQPRRSARLFENSQTINPLSDMPTKPKKKKKKKKKKKGYDAQNVFCEEENDIEKEGYESPDDKKIIPMNMGMPLLGGTSSEGWSKEQDVALHNAYYTLKLSDTFWKDVAKLVPGKSSKECFDRFYSSYPTPRVSRSKSRLNDKVCGSPIRTLNVDTLLKSIRLTARRFHNNQQRILEAHRAVRWMLGRYKIADKEYEADVFSSVESADSSIEPPLLPTSNPISPNILLKSVGNSNQTQPDDSRKSLPGLKLQLFSPEVLKQIKDPTQHEKYIDLLHFREEARRKAWTQNAKVPASQIVTEIPKLPRTEAVSVAKAAMVAEAQQMLIQSQNSMFSENGEDRREEEDEDYADDDEIIDYT